MKWHACGKQTEIKITQRRKSQILTDQLRRANQFPCTSPCAWELSWGRGHGSSRNKGTDMAIAEAWLCVQLTIFVLIRAYVLSCWKIQWWPRFSFLAGAARFRFKMSYFMEFMMQCPPPEGLWKKNSHATSQKLHLHNTYIQVIFGIGILLFMPNPPWVLVVEKLHFTFIWPLNTFLLKVPVAFSKLQALTFVVKWQEILFSGMPSK